MRCWWIEFRAAARLLRQQIRAWRSCEDAVIETLIAANQAATSSRTRREYREADRDALNRLGKATSAQVWQAQDHCRQAERLARRLQDRRQKHLRIV